jgi:hypothetical protein
MASSHGYWEEAINSYVFLISSSDLQRVPIGQIYGRMEKEI